ncbi:MAG: S1 RNA-binding domain-containing protein [Alphaproteobacteria bacterium]|nr:S1 RNA-binding domain-containing protein [Alphaproteobacteria bacterium]
MPDKRPVRRRSQADVPEPVAAPDPEVEEGFVGGAFRRPHDEDDAPTQRRARRAQAASLDALEALAKGEIDMEALLAGPARPPPLPEPGTQVQGAVVRITADGVHVDLGGRASGWIARREVPEARVGDVISAFVLDVEDGAVTLSRRLTGDAAAVHLAEAAEHGLPVEGLVASRHGGGYAVRVGPLRAFCPQSQIARIPLADPDAVIGQTLTFKVLQGGDDVVLSRRALEEAELEPRRAARLASIAEGQVVEAVVTGVQPWGAFLDVDGVELRMPAREATWEEVSDLTTRLDRGARLQVRVVAIEPDGGRITVSARDPALDPWATAASRLPVGRVLPGRVVSCTDFGAFVEVAPGLQGLVHRSRVAALPPEGTTLEVRVLSVDEERRRLELAPGDFDPAQQAANGVGVEVEGEVVEVGDRGVAVHLADGRRAWLPAGEVELTPGTLLSQRFRVGHAITARVIRADPGKVVLSTRPADEEGAWRDALRQQGSAGMGTLGDLFTRRRP